MAWGICEWYGTRIDLLSADQRRKAAEDSLSNKPVSELEHHCPFVQHLQPGAKCNKSGGVCSIRPYGEGQDGISPAATCPRRLLAQDENGRDVFDLLASECFGQQSNDSYALVREVPFLDKVDRDGKARGAKAGRIDWVLVSDPDQSPSDWLAIETQAVYFSGGGMEVDFQMYATSPEKLNVTSKNRRPDWRSSGAKRLSPQLSAKSPVMRRWGKKVAVVVDQGFFDELSKFKNDDIDFDNSEVVWVVVKYDSQMSISVAIERYAELDESVDALQATRPVVKSKFEKDLIAEVSKRSPKVHFKSVP